MKPDWNDLPTDVKAVLLDEMTFETTYDYPKSEIVDEVLGDFACSRVMEDVIYQYCHNVDVDRLMQVCLNVEMDLARRVDVIKAFHEQVRQIKD